MGPAFLIPAAISAIGTGAQAYNQNRANSAQDAAETQGIINQQSLQEKAASGVNALTKQIATDTPSQIASKATGEYVQQLRKNAGAVANGQGGSTSSLAPAIGANSRYNTGVAASNAAVQDYGDTNAQEM